MPYNNEHWAFNDKVSKRKVTTRQAVRKNRLVQPLSVQLGKGLREAALFTFAAAALFVLLALVSYDVRDPGWSHTGAYGVGVRNLGGIVGAWFADLAFYLMGDLAFLAPIMLGYSGWLIYRGEGETGSVSGLEFGLRWFGFFATLVAGCGLAELHFASPELPMHAGGLLGKAVGVSLAQNFNLLGATLLLLAALLSGMTLFTAVSWVTVLEVVGDRTLKAYAWTLIQLKKLQTQREIRKVREERNETLAPVQKKQRKRRRPRIEPKVDKPELSTRPLREKQLPLFSPPKDGALPAIDLLDPAPERKKGYSRESLEAISRQVELKLADFKVEAEVDSVHPGPVVTRFELNLAPGTKVSKITGLAKDLARALSVISVRVVEVIPGKSTIGIEIPNESRETVALSEVLSSKEYDKSAAPLTLGLGKDISGKPIMADVAKMPHLLVAGTTGSGKSVAVNAMLLSILFKSTPKEVRLILIDPKMLELSVYDEIPHLLTPVVTDMKDAANALRWSVGEMERRYQLMSKMGVRNLAGFNRKVIEAQQQGEPIKDPLWRPNELLEDDVASDLEPLPKIVVVVDEFADLMMTVGKKVEELIARLAQKARAAGIHLILATQRPSVDVITGLIKANIPSRIAFQVSSKIDSRTILDQMGAEQLLGYGDMLYLPGGTSLPVRVHGAFVDDHEVLRVTDALRAQGEPEYIEEITTGDDLDAPLPGMEPIDTDGETDALYDQAVAVVTESRKASISFVQRRLKVGYNRAARMIEQMEQAGIVSAVQGNGTREVLAPPPPEL